MATASRKMEKVHKIWVEPSGRRVKLMTLTQATLLIKQRLKERPNVFLPPAE